MLNAITSFKNDESGAVTVDWVVLTAALVGLGLAVMGVVSTGIGDVSKQISSDLTVDQSKLTATNFAAAKATVTP